MFHIFSSNFSRFWLKMNFIDSWVYLFVQVKSKALILADMNAYLQSQIDIDEELKGIIVQTTQDIQRLIFNYIVPFLDPQREGPMILGPSVS